MLEGLGLGAELGGPGLQGHSLLCQTRDVDGGLLVEARLVVEQWDITAERQGLAACRGHLEDRTRRSDSDTRDHLVPHVCICMNVRTHAG